MASPTGTPPKADDGDALPGYTAPAPGIAPPTDSKSPAAAPDDGTEHVYALERKGRTWLTLRMRGSRARTATELPVLFDGDAVRGAVELDLDKPEGAKAVTISVFAGTTAVGQEELRFLEVARELWPAGAASGSAAKLQGKHVWPFALALPPTVEVHAEKRPLGTHALPPSFSERAAPAYVDYRVVATVRRGAFRVDQTLATSFTYLPRSRAGAPSALRQAADLEGAELVGPEGDPEGWKVLAPISIKARLFDKEDVDVQCTIALAAPLEYAAGTPLPLFCTLSSANAAALDLLSAPRALTAQLTRTLAIGSAAMDTAGASVRRSNNTFVVPFGRAVWWPAPGSPEDGVRRLRGEIQVRRGLKPTSVFPRHSVWYDVLLLPPSAPGFATVGDAAEPLHAERVAVTTGSAAGVAAARSRAPPEYANEPEENYNVSVGLLENGNQRFLGHHGHFGGQ